MTIRLALIRYISINELIASLIKLIEPAYPYNDSESTFRLV